MSAPRFDGKVAIVTGGGSGIGAATARRLASEGARVVVADVADEAGVSVADEIGGTFMRLDVGDPDAWARVVTDTQRDLGGIDLAHLNAGIALRAYPVVVEDLSDADYRRIMGVNADGPFFMAQAAIPHLLATEGNIVNVASTAAIEGQAYTVAYCMSKAAIALMTKAIAMEYVKTPLRVNAVLPGGTQTALVDAVSFPDDIDFNLVLNYSGFRGMNSPDEVAAVVAFAASDDASAVHGALLPVDRGALAD